MPDKSSHTPYANLSAFDEQSGDLNAVIETPQGSRNKYEYDQELGLFKLSGVLPVGAVFPFDFGYVPSTLGGDGDPLDVLVLMDEPVFAGCLVPARLIGAIEAEQTEKGETTRNDRLIAVAVDSRNHGDVRSLDQINDNLIHEIEHFFISYNTIKGKEFSPIGRAGPEQARRLVEEGIKRFQQSRRKSSDVEGGDKEPNSKKGQS